MKYTNFIKCLLASIPLLSFWGCESEDLPNSGQGELVPVTIRLTTTAPDDVQTRANEHTAELVNNDYTISSLNVYITDGSSTTTLNYDDFTFSGSDEGSYQGTSNSTVELVRGRTYTVYAIANADITNYSDHSVNAIAAVNETVPMSAQTTWTINGGTESIILVRMVAKMNVTLIDERTSANKPIITSVKIGNLPDATRLYRQSKGSVSLPSDVNLTGSWEQNNNNSWSWTNNTESHLSITFSDFYLHEMNGGTVEVQETGKEARKGSFTAAVPRNYVFPLHIYIRDYALSIDAKYEYAPIGVYPIKEELNGYSAYELEIPEGSSNIEIKISLKVNGNVVSTGVSWDKISIPYFTSSVENGVLTLKCEAFPAIPSGPYIITATYDGKEIPFELSLRELGDTEWTRSTSPEAQPIIIEL